MIIYVPAEKVEVSPLITASKTQDSGYRHGVKSWSNMHNDVVAGFEKVSIVLYIQVLLSPASLTAIETTVQISTGLAANQIRPFRRLQRFVHWLEGNCARGDKPSREMLDPAPPSDFSSA